MPELTAMKGSSLRVGDATLNYVTSGTENGPTVVVLHGGMGCLNDIAELVRCIPEDMRVIAMEFRGHGRSTLGSEPLSYARYQHDVEAVLEHLGVERFSVVGFSDGGIVAYRLAAAHPDSVKRIITLGAQWRLSPDDPSLPLLQSLDRNMWLEMFPDALDLYESRNPEPDFDALLAAVRDLWTDHGPSGYPAETVAQITAPLLIIRGDNDPLFSVEEAVALQAKVSGAALLNIPFAGHEVHKEAEQIVGMYVSRFLALQS
ncbi:alpha/beta fold hydrolase [Oleidesulfovibrio sp.]|uniref:alpha/beta fold hydrolase n=1 Tax=Oleidesulfovibrio sp. TaxID=2909707 RepID=UPI003A8A8953